MTRLRSEELNVLSSLRQFNKLLLLQTSTQYQHITVADAVG